MTPKIFNIPALLCLSIIFFFTACDDFLERNHPTGITDDDFWNTAREIEAAFESCKRMPHGTYHYTSPYISLVHMEGMTDNMYHTANFKGEIVTVGNGTYTPSTGGYIPDIWREYYILIRRCNRLLDNIHRAYFTDENDRNRIIAEVKVWRAWYHMQLLLYYGINDGIPIVDKTLNPNEIYLERNSVEECIQFINKELQEVIDSHHLEFLWDEGRRDRMSESIAWTLMMDLNLQFQRYDVAKKAALEIINSEKFELHYTTLTDDDPGKNYRDLFRYNGRQNKERILFTRRGLQEFWFRSMTTTLGGQGTACPLKSLVDTYETLEGIPIETLSDEDKRIVERSPLAIDRDPRLFASVMLPGDDKSVNGFVYLPFNWDGSDAVGKPGASRSGYMLKKYLDEQDRTSPYSGNLDFVIYRYAEVLLTYVECLVESGDWQNPDVERYINQIRHRAGMPSIDKTVYNSEEKVRELYQRERRVELAFEGKRYFDIRRWDLGEKVMNARAEGAWNPDANNFIIVEERSYKFPKNDSWPIPQSEMTSNPNITQSTGW